MNLADRLLAGAIVLLMGAALFAVAGWAASMWPLSLLLLPGLALFAGVSWAIGGWAARTLDGWGL